MKIKEVIEKTGLTDRAIRLYINEGLAAPSIEESYSGRKSIEFSESDVERLKNVAVLRKAGFSISDIRSMVDNKSTAKDVVEKFIEQTENNIAHETQIVEKLKGISFDEEVTLEIICESLSAEVEKKEVPREDVKLTVAEKMLKILTIVLSCSLLAVAVYAFVICCLIVFDVRYIKLTEDIGMITASLFYLGWVVIAVLLITVISKNIGKRFNRKTKGSSWGLLILSAVGSAGMIIITFFWLFCTITPVYSQTTDPENYLKLDETLQEYVKEDYPNYFLGDVAFDVFPKRIPRNAKAYNPDSIRYFYEYRPCWDGYYGSYDIFAEWVLLPSDYEKAKSDLPGDIILENDLFLASQHEFSDRMPEEFQENFKEYLVDSAIKSSDYKTVERGDWTFVYYEKYIHSSVWRDETGEAEGQNKESENEFAVTDWSEAGTYSILFCAYNDKEQKIRYTVSERCGHEHRNEGPYYTTLDW